MADLEVVWSVLWRQIAAYEDWQGDDGIVDYARSRMAWYGTQDSMNRCILAFVLLKQVRYEILKVQLRTIIGPDWQRCSRLAKSWIDATSMRLSALIGCPESVDEWDYRKDVDDLMESIGQ